MSDRYISPKGLQYLQNLYDWLEYKSHPDYLFDMGAWREQGRCKTTVCLAGGHLEINRGGKWNDLYRGWQLYERDGREIMVQTTMAYFEKDRACLDDCFEIQDFCSEDLGVSRNLFDRESWPYWAQEMMSFDSFPKPVSPTLIRTTAAKIIKEIIEGNIDPVTLQYPDPNGGKTDAGKLESIPF